VGTHNTGIQPLRISHKSMHSRNPGQSSSHLLPSWELINRKAFRYTSFSISIPKHTTYVASPSSSKYSLKIRPR